VLSRRLYRHQRGRRPLAAVAAAGLVVSILVVANTAVAVHDEGVFQLDGNATTQPGTSDPVNNQSNTTGTHDWDQVYADRNYTGNPPFPTSGAQSQAFVTDGFGAGDSILTGGGTKDINDIQANWLWKQTSTTSVQDKDDIEHAFAAQYKVDKSGATDACGTGSNGDPIKTANCVLLYFGADRFSNSGNTTMGFWFFKNEITPVGPDASGNGTFTGVHTARSSSGHGDILIVTDFLTGGQAPTATVYEWVASGGNTTTHLDKIGGGTVTAADCTEGAPSGGGKSPTPVPPVSNNDNLCATVNANVVSVPWAFTPKPNTGGTAGTGGSTTKYGISEFMEGGINMTALGLGNECFNTFMAETRASSSPTSTLSDFALGNFGSCNATAVTTPSASTVSPGEQIRDHIEITGHSSGGNPPTPTSPANVVFSYCGPITSGICDGSDAAHTAASFGATKALSEKSPGVAQADSDYINTSGSPLSPGRYCFAGSWAGDANYTAGARDNGSNECFTVRQIGTSTVTTPSDSSGTALSGTQDLGTTLYDKAVVTASAAGGGNVTGTVDFFICSPSQVQGAAGSETCATGGTALSGNPRTLSPISGANPPASSVLSSPGVPANVAGVWCFRAVYTPTGTTYTGSSDATHGECVTVGPENTNTVTTPRTTGTTTTFTTGPVNSSVTDHAVVTAADNVDGTPTGTINFFICSPSQLDSSGLCSTGGTAAGSKAAAAVSGSAPPASQADSDAVIANVVGKWCFRAVYVPGGTNGANYNGSSDSSASECFTITDSTSASSAQTWVPNDTGTIAATGGTPLNGTLSIQLYEGNSCASGSEVSGQLYTKTLTDATTLADRSLTTSNTTYSVSVSKSVSWLVTFTPTTGSFVSGDSHCEVTSLTITN
jgi:hypothetical protein